MNMQFGGKSDMRFGHNALPHIPIMYTPNDIPKNTRLVVAVKKHLKSLADEAIKESLTKKIKDEKAAEGKSGKETKKITGKGKDSGKFGEEGRTSNCSKEEGGSRQG